MADGNKKKKRKINVYTTVLAHHSHQYNLYFLYCNLQFVIISRVGTCKCVPHI